MPFCFLQICAEERTDNRVVEFEAAARKLDKKVLAKTTLSNQRSGIQLWLRMEIMLFANRKIGRLILTCFSPHDNVFLGIMLIPELLLMGRLVPCLAAPTISV